MSFQHNGRKPFNKKLKKQASPKIDEARLSSPITSYSLPQEELEKIFKNIKPQTPPSMLNVGLLTKKAKFEEEKRKK